MQGCCEVVKGDVRMRGLSVTGGVLVSRWTYGMPDPPAFGSRKTMMDAEMVTRMTAKRERWRKASQTHAE